MYPYRIHRKATYGADNDSNTWSLILGKGAGGGFTSVGTETYEESTGSFGLKLNYSINGGAATLYIGNTTKKDGINTKSVRGEITLYGNAASNVTLRLPDLTTTDDNYKYTTSYTVNLQYKNGTIALLDDIANHIQTQSYTKSADNTANLVYHLPFVKSKTRNVKQDLLTYPDDSARLQFLSTDNGHGGLAMLILGNGISLTEDDTTKRKGCIRLFGNGYSSVYLVPEELERTNTWFNHPKMFRLHIPMKDGTLGVKGEQDIQDVYGTNDQNSYNHYNIPYTDAPDNRGSTTSKTAESKRLIYNGDGGFSV